MAGANRHSLPVQKWLNEVVLALGFCPWAQTANEAGGIRVVTSKSTTSKEVLDDLISEAKELWTSETGQTSLVVCPNVQAWNQDFRFFHAFFTWYLDSGFALVENLGIRVVAFHPAFALQTKGPETGDVVMVPGPDGQDAEAQVIEKNVGTDETGDYCMAVRFANGEEGLIRYAALMAKPSSQSSDIDLCENFTSRAPRPVLQLLRIPDLIKAEEELSKSLGLKGEPKEMEELDKKTTGSAFRNREENVTRKKGQEQGEAMTRQRIRTSQKEDGPKESVKLRSATQSIADQNAIKVQSLGPLRLTEILENCELIK